MLSVVFMVNSLKCLKLNQNAYTSHILCTWSVWAYASMCIYCYTLSTTPLRTFLHSDWYTPEAPIFFFAFPTLCCNSSFSQGEFSCRKEVFLSTLVYAWWVHLPTRRRDFEISRFLYQGGCVIWSCWSLGEILGRDRGRKIEPFGAFASCVKLFASFWRN
jgi:hypothetical protein